jgi:hypothetical protein
MLPVENIRIHSITEDPKYNSPKGTGVVIEYNDVVQDCLGLCCNGTKYKSDGETFLTLTFVVYEEYHPPKKRSKVE